MHCSNDVGPKVPAVVPPEADGVSVATGVADVPDMEGVMVPGKMDAFIPVDGRTVAGRVVEFAMTGPSVDERSAEEAGDGTSVAAGTVDAFVPNVDGVTVAGKADEFIVEGTSVATGRSAATAADGASVIGKADVFDAFIPVDGESVPGTTVELDIDGSGVDGEFDCPRPGVGALVSLTGGGSLVVGVPVAVVLWVTVGVAVPGVAGLGDPPAFDGGSEVVLSP